MSEEKALELKPAKSRSDGAHDDDESGGLSLLDILVALGEQRWLFLGVSLLGAVLSLTWALLVPRYYTANTVIMPPQQQQGAGAAALAQLGALANLAGAGAQSKASDELYAAMLQSRTVATALVRKFDLKHRYQVTTDQEARNALAFATTVGTDKKTGLIGIEVDDRDPKVAAAMANEYVTQLRALLSTLAVTEAQQRRMFFEGQVEKTKGLLVAAEIAFKRAQANSGMVVTQVLAESGVRSSIELRTQIAVREVQLQSLSRYATSESAEVRQSSSELMAMRQQLKKLESGGQTASNVGPEANAAVEAYRNVKVYEAGLETLIKQAELAKIDESKDGPLLQQLDPAQPPERALKPKRSVIAIAGTLAAMMLAVVLALGRSYLNRGSEPTGPVARVLTAWALRSR
jgi:tyrosine-protein kinase Etk/Wzc